MQKVILYFITRQTINCGWYQAFVVHPFQPIDVWFIHGYAVHSGAGSTGSRTSPVQTQGGGTGGGRGVMGQSEEVVARVTLRRGEAGLPFVQKGGAEQELPLGHGTHTSTGSFLMCSSHPSFPIRHRCRGCTKATFLSSELGQSQQVISGFGTFPVLLQTD